MDPATLIGIVLAFGALYATVTLEGAHIEALLLPAPMILVFGATLAVGLAGSTMKDTLRALRALPKAFAGRRPQTSSTIETMVSLAEKARVEGLLSLESQAADSKDPFLAKALQSLADGTDSEDLRTMLEDEIAARQRTERSAARFFQSLGGYAPTIGIVGTVVSLTHVLEKLSTPDALGPLIASAFVATLWGLLSANFLWLPIAQRLNRLADLEEDRLTIILEGALALQAGAQPVLLADRLRALAPETAPSRGAGKAAA
ncbi:motility protein A [Sinomonas halotolerans]|uniref:MotA/TolQ/ExbB proton channel family protein n=1 Tax=Sinomonas halotolerans TaxID=1644133 RepID=A0ABU9WYT5_9MICC